MKIVGHRGARAKEPENTLRAVRTGLACADCIEIDVRMSRDGIPVIMHDATLERTTNGRGAVRDHSFAEIRTLDAGAGERVPTLAEVLDLMAGRATLLVELKERGGLETIVEVITSAQAKRIILVSFLAEALARAEQLLPAVPRGLIYSTAGRDPFADARSVNASFILPRFDQADAEMIGEAHAQRLRVILWTLNTADDLHAAAVMGADAVATDDPCMARSVLRKSTLQR
ncbi:MAG: glycerophosphodiester phosphodiesterase [Methanomicrobiales archaeon]|nr:glycerophosphodiester phosphodiesterase [Methanomicrobiales archaeon]